MAVSGQCLCGAVSYTAEDVTGDAGVCHCGQCRRWAAGPYFAMPSGRVTFEGEQNLGRYRSSKWAERGFCTKCGSSLFYRMLKSDRYMMAVGSFDDPSGFNLGHQVFIDDKPDFYEFANETSNSTGDDFFVRHPDLERS